MTKSTRNHFRLGLVILSAVALAACDAERPGAATGGPGATGGSSGAAGSSLVISGREAARRLAVVIWDDLPDAALVAEADSGAIQTSEDVRKLAARMLKDARARKGVGAFYRWWLKLDSIAEVTKDPLVFPQFTPDLRADMAKESELLGVHVTLDLDGVVDMLFTLPFSFLTERTAGIYEIAGVVGAEHRKVALDPAQRAGLLTNPGLLSLLAKPTGTSISGRGLFVNERILCRPIPPERSGAVDGPPPPQPAGMTGRDYLTKLLLTQGCNPCHAMMDNPGYAFEGLDAIGRARTTDNGGQVITSGSIPGARGEPLDFNGPRELARRMVGVDETPVCFARQWLSFALGSGDPVRPTADVASLANDLAARAGRNIQQLIAGVLASDLFLARDAIR